MPEQLELLNGDEFSDPRMLAKREFSAISGDIAGDTPYPEPHFTADKSRWGSNPLYTAGANREYDRAHEYRWGDAEETFLPSYEIESPQGRVNEQSVNHLVANASGLDVPNISAYQFGDTTMVMNGNHRVNAALQRGQMLVPATLRKAFQ